MGGEGSRMAWATGSRPAARPWTTGPLSRPAPLNGSFRLGGAPVSLPSHGTVRTGGTGWRTGAPSVASAVASTPRETAAQPDNYASDHSAENDERDAVVAALGVAPPMSEARRVTTQRVSWDTLCGLTDLKLELQAIAEEDEGGPRWAERVILLYGPPGCGKMLAVRPGAQQHHPF